MHLEVTADVGELDEVRETVLLGGFDLAGHFAQLRGDVIEAELGVDFLFGFSGYGLAALQRGQGVFVERPAHFVGAAAEGDVVLLRSGEIEQRGAEIFFAEKAQVDLQAAFEQDADFVSAVGEGLADGRVTQDVFGDFVDIFLGIGAGLHGEEEIEVAYRFACRGGENRRALRIRLVRRPCRCRRKSAGLLLRRC